MGRSDYWEPGSWNAVCSMCGFKRKAGTLTKNWQGLWRCPVHNEIRQPQDYTRAIPDIQTPPWTQPPSTDVFATTSFLCTENSDLTDFDPMFFIETETLYPIQTEA